MPARYHQRTVAHGTASADLTPLPETSSSQKSPAHASGLTTIIFPERNESDLDEVPVAVREQMQFHPVTSVDEVLALALEPHALAMVA